jgi:UDP-3-O-[3-hydroxymyristoyl] glucosamine N-acyltransferase
MKFNVPLEVNSLKSFEGFIKVIGDINGKISGINEIHMVEKGDITFVDHPKYYKKALESAATYILINTEDVPVPVGKTIVVCEDPFSIYNAVVGNNVSFPPTKNMLGPGASIGEGTVIQPGAFVGDNVIIGKNCFIFPNVTLLGPAIIGDNVIIQSSTVIGSDAFYYKRRPDHYEKMLSGGRTIIGNNVEIGAACTIDKGVSGDTIIGEGTKLDNQVHIGHDTHIGKNCLLAAQVGVAGVVVIEDEVILWGQVGVQKDLTIGKGAIVLGQSGVTKSIAGATTYFGTPAVEARKKWKELATLRKLSGE